VIYRMVTRLSLHVQDWLPPDQMNARGVSHYNPACL